MCGAYKVRQCAQRLTHLKSSDLGLMRSCRCLQLVCRLVQLLLALGELFGECHLLAFLLLEGVDLCPSFGELRVDQSGMGHANLQPTVV